MSRELEIYNDNLPLQTALDGEKPQLERYFKRKGLPITESILQRSCLPSRQVGVSRYAFIRTLIAGLVGIGRESKAIYLADSFAVLTPIERKRMFGGKWIEEVWSKVGELTALYTAGIRGAEFDFKRTEILWLMRVEVV